MIIWFTGQSGAGKTTIARQVYQIYERAVILDGDEMRSSISRGLGFSKEDRMANNMRIARLAKVLERYVEIVLVSVITPMQNVRDMITHEINPVWIYVKRTLPEREGHFYEEPVNYPVLDHDKLSVVESVNKTLNIIGSYV